MRRKFAASLLLLLPLLDLGGGARADEGGGSFWVPGQDAVNLAAMPPSPGWSVPVTLYYYTGSTPSSAAPSAAVPPGTHAQTTQFSFSPTWAPETRLLRGQVALSLSFGVGRNATQVDATATSGPQSQTVEGLLDLSPTATLAWQDGAENWMLYLTGNIPAGSYDSQRLSNVGLGRAAADAGFLYSYDNPATGRSGSAALGVTYNFTNHDTNYRSGIDAHLDLSAMLPLAEALRAGLTGYVYYQLTDDSGSGNTCGSCKSRVAGIGPQLSYTFTVAGQEWSANLRGYYEFWARNRLEGYTLFASLTIPIGGSTDNGTGRR